jgi:CubicO group peptidase (beta-lactamase class C family)
VRLDVGSVVDRIRVEIPELLAEHGIPGLAVGICNRSDVLWAAGFGSTRPEGAGEITTRTLFSIQSCSKMYTATAVMLAVQAGLVDLDEPITTYLPEFTVNSRFEANPERRITLRHLLNHRAGFTHEAPVGNNYLIGRASFEAHCQSISDTWLRFPVGQHYDYSNLGIDLAAYVLQRRSGLPFHEFGRRNLLAPLGLGRTTFDQKRIACEPERALGHDVGVKRLPLRIPMVAAGGLYSSIEDACRFVGFHLASGEGLLDARLLHEMYSIQFPQPGQNQGSGLGVVILRRNGLIVRGHSGGGLGFLSDMYWAPEANIGVVVLTNSSSHPLQSALAHKILGDLAGSAERPDETALQPAVEAAGAELDRFAGEYVGRSGSLGLIAEGPRLLLKTKEEERVLRLIAGDRVQWEEASHDRYRFLTDTAGHVEYLQHVETGHGWYRNKADRSEPELNPAYRLWADSEGEYELRVSGVKIGSVSLGRDESGPFIGWPRQGKLRLKQHDPGLYFSSTGEALDMRRTPPTYGNIRLVKAAHSSPKA